VRGGNSALLVAIGWAAVVVASVVVAAWRRTRSGSSAGTDDRVVGLRSADLLIGGFVGIAAFTGILVAGHLTVRFTVFGAIALTYLVLVVGVPVVMASSLVAGWVFGRRRAPAGGARLGTRPALVLCVAGLLLAPVGIYATHIEPGMLDVDRPAPLVVAGERAGDQTFTIGVLTDLQTTTIGDRERAVVADLMATRPDLILLPGDILQVSDPEFDQQLPALRRLLGGMDAPGGVYLVGGDVDKPLDRLSRMVEGTTVRYLANEVVTTEVGDREVSIGGLGVEYDSPAAKAVVAQLETDPGDDDIRILLAHRPDPVLELRPDSRIDLQVSGHTHGGQVAVPFIGPLMTMSSVPRSIAAGGLHEHQGNPIYVGHGVGVERWSAPQVRFGVRPDIGVLTVSG
jgi:predicted MPP superfamily phosphohydrolase